MLLLSNSASNNGGKNKKQKKSWQKTHFVAIKSQATVWKIFTKLFPAAINKIGMVNIIANIITNNL